MKFIICLQFHNGDRDRAMRLARFIADLEPAFRTDTEFLFVARYDCDHDHDTIRHVNAKFRVNWITSHTKWTGWPGGPNGMARDTLEWLSVDRGDSGGALLFEPDCVPVKANWIDVLMKEWDRARFAEKIIMGAWRPSGGVDGHLNGNCIVRPNFARQVNLECIRPDLAWDAAVAPYIKNRWFKTGVIKNCFDSVGATEEGMRTPDEGTEPPALIHGYKDDSAMNIATAWLRKE